MIDFRTLSTRDVSDIALQRTATLIRIPLIGALSYRLWTLGIDWSLKVESIARRRAILSGAWRDAEREWGEIAPFLPRDSARLCDIGCGHAFIDLVAAQNSRSLSITLVDIERTPERRHGFGPRGSAYASLANAKRFLTANNVPSQSIETCNPTHAPLPPGPYDLVISLLSAGHHYPVHEYATFALQALRPNGAFIFDMRHGTNQNSALSGFKAVRRLHATEKYARIAAIK